MPVKPTVKVMPRTQTVLEEVEVTPELKQELQQFAKSPVPESVNLDHYRPKKKAISIRMDLDVLSWFQAQPGKYQQLINQACREYMQLEQAKEK